VKTALVILALVACDNGDSTPDWSRMITQPKVLPFGETPMRQAPAGAIARDWDPDVVRRTGQDGAGSDTETIPVPITRPLLERGRDRFAIVCAPCHGTQGDGDSVVAHAMQRRPPPSLFEPRLVALAPGALFRIIARGYGFMPAYAGVMTEADRWAVVAYVRTLELAAGRLR
jgi:mono/diheme cytochrome c family protein